MDKSTTGEEVDLYLRLSVDAEGADSIERQERDLRAWADREGLRVREVWSDAGRSGYRDVKRAGFESALAALANAEVRTLAVWKLDRLSRRGAGQIGVVLDDVERVGGRLVFLRDGLDTSSGNASRLPIVTMSEISRAESANTSLRVKSRKHTDRLAGQYLGGLPPYGYAVDDARHFVPLEPEFSSMREVVWRVLEGESLMTICRDFNERGVLTQRAKKHLAKRDRLPGPGCDCGTDEKPCKESLWRPSALSAALRSPGLAGLMPEKTTDEHGRWKAAVVAWRHPDTGETVSLMAPGREPIASEAEQARLLSVMDSRLRQYGRGSRPVRQPKSLLGGLLVCASCGRTAHTFGNSYRCRKWKADASDCAAPLSVSVEAVEEAVVRAWVGRLAQLHDEPESPLLAAVADRWLQKFDPAPLRERERLRSDLEDVKTRLASADDDHYVKATLDIERYARVSARLEEQRARLVLRLAELPQPEADLGALLDPELSLPAFTTASVPEQRDLLRLAIERVEVSRAPKRGTRFDPSSRMRVSWVGD
ncbi:hypothetical protein GCM10011519_33760 [Marmoricola endophyticus]|uniref:Recombinase family protein n=1 Tax=Marmoricola endophyticus TaxID=2040280 RepID=A0A917BUA1_9ACTN|nr:recombinase family protein [Marmoricola endophyticus]GGF57040.1 hypothetical protein GCM10011519_33760 [Marmoricola endophyticus]